MYFSTGGRKMRRVVMIICLIVVPVLSLAQTTNIRDRDGRLIGTKHYDSTSRETQYRDRDGRLEYTGNRNGNDYQIRDRSGRLKWTEQAED
jgi:hypothetical protein